jgi:hypothetical protein
MGVYDYQDMHESAGDIWYKFMPDVSVRLVLDQETQGPRANIAIASSASSTRARSSMALGLESSVCTST